MNEGSNKTESKQANSNSFIAIASELSHKMKLLQSLQTRVLNLEEELTQIKDKDSNQKQDPVPIEDPHDLIGTKISGTGTKTLSKKECIFLYRSKLGYLYGLPAQLSKTQVQEKNFTFIGMRSVETSI